MRVKWGGSALHSAVSTRLETKKKHCTDEAQKAETVSASDVLVVFFQKEMPTQDEYPKSVVLHFPPSVYQKIGAAEMIPKLLEIFNVEDLRCLQFLRNGKVRVSFREKEVRDHYLVEGMRFGDHDIPVTKDGQKVSVLCIRDLPYEVSSDELVDFFSNYGEVLTVERSVAENFPNLCNGNRVLKMILNEELPYFLYVCGCQCRVWYRGQPIQCFVCRELGHRAQACPLSGRCRHCHQVGHMARECARAWDPHPSVSAVPADVDPPVKPVADSVDNSSDAVMSSEDVDKSVDKPPVDKLVDKLPVAPINDVDKPSAVPLCSTMPVDKSVDKLPVNNSSVVMTNDVADKPVDKPPALLSWPRSTIPGTTIVRDFLPLAAAGPKYHSLYGSVRGFIQKMTPAQFMKMSALELKTSITDFLWTKNISPDSAVLEGLLLRLSKLKKALEKL